MRKPSQFAPPPPEPQVPLAPKAPAANIVARSAPSADVSSELQGAAAEEALEDGCSARATPSKRPASALPDVAGLLGAGGVKAAKSSHEPAAPGADASDEVGGGQAGAGFALSNKAIVANITAILQEQPGVAGADVEEVTNMLGKATIGNLALLDLEPSVVSKTLKPGLRKLCLDCGLGDGGSVEELKKRLLDSRADLREGRNVGPVGLVEKSAVAPDVLDEGSDDEEGASSRPKAKHLTRGRAASREEGVQGALERTAALRKKEDAKKLKAGEVVGPVDHPVSKHLTIDERRDLCDASHVLRVAQNVSDLESFQAGVKRAVLKSGEAYDAWCESVARIEEEYSGDVQEAICGKEKTGTLITRFRRVLFDWARLKVLSGYLPRNRERWVSAL